MLLVIKVVAAKWTALLQKEVVTDFSMAFINSVCMSFPGCAEGSPT